MSGFYLSRTELTRQIASVVLLEEHVVEVALLLIEAEIDLRFRSNETFSFGDVNIWATFRSGNIHRVVPEFVS